MIQIATAVDGLFMQFTPCFILVVFTMMILCKINESKARKASLKRRPSLNSSGKRVTSKSDTKNEDQTSNTLLAIVILFLICELPIACLLFSGIFDRRILYYVARRIYLLARTIRLINASFNFILYCSMSQLFRSTFEETFGNIFLRMKYVSNSNQNERVIPRIEMSSSSQTNSTSQQRSEKSISQLVEVINHQIREL